MCGSLLLEILLSNRGGLCNALYNLEFMQMRVAIQAGQHIHELDGKSDWYCLEGRIALDWMDDPKKLLVYAKEHPDYAAQYLHAEIKLACALLEKGPYTLQDWQAMLAADRRRLVQ